MNLVKELTRIKETQFKEADGEKILGEAKTLLLGAHNEDIAVLEALGLNNAVVQESIRRDDILRSAKAEEIYSTASFTGAQIKALCNNYDLKLLPVGYYKGHVPATLPAKVKEFAERNEIKVNMYDFFILAPSELFQPQKYVDPTPKDPILFYRQRDGGPTSHMPEKAEKKHVFLQVDNWGNDFTFLRSLNVLFSGYKGDRSDNITPTRSTTLVVLIALVVSMIIAACGWFWISMVPFVVALIETSRLIKSKFPSDKLWNVNVI